jgi:putative FmdB family regulatory protein
MPVHTYHCEECGHEFDAHQAFSDDSLTICPNCGKAALYKVYKPALVLFRGSGFYVTDTKSSSSTLTSNANHKAGDNGSKDDTKKDTTKTEPSKTEKKKSKKKEA